MSGENRPPSKPWRVIGNGTTSSHRGQCGAYDFVNSLTAAGHGVLVEHWEDGRWVKYEVLDPAETEN
jgi:hypothetical protein